MAQQKEKNRFLLFYIGSMVMLVVLATFGYFYLHQRNLAAIERMNVPYVLITDLTHVDLPRITVSVGNMAYRQAYIDISLEVSRKDVPTIQGYVPQIMDRLNTYFPKARLNQIEHPQTVLVLRRDMLWQVRSLHMPASVHDVVLRKLVIM